ncbi:helix-turn-helix domain-containing protein [Streptomyces sp. NPDC032198]|uniref:helix-turn-helix domain-containing protein n=1 Tax=Streptomyces sp. NPDC032198 TaxID=3155127 RepID=UPI00340AB95F
MSTRRTRHRSKGVQQHQPRVTAAPTAHAPAGTPEDARAEAVRGLMAPGEQRLRLVAELDRLDTALWPLVVQAVHAGVPYRRIAELTNISRATVARWGKQDPEA